MVGGIRHMRIGILGASLMAATLAGAGLIEVHPGRRYPVEPEPEPLDRTPPAEPAPDPFTPTLADLSAVSAADAKRARRNARRAALSRKA